MPVINGVYLKDFTALPGSVADANIIPIAITGDNIAYRTTVAGIVTDARITSKLLTGLSVTGGAVVAADTILQAFGKVQNQINGKQGTITLTTTGTSGAATFVSNTLNIPNYGGALSGYLPLTGGTLTGTLSGTSASFIGPVTIGATGVYGSVQFKRSSDGAVASYVRQTDFNQLDIVSAGGTSILRLEATTINFRCFQDAVDPNAIYNFGQNRPTSSQVLINGINNNKLRIQNNETDVIVLNSADGSVQATSASFSSTATASAFIPSGATVPTNGMYLSAANTLDFATNTTKRLSISSAGVATFSEALSGTSASFSNVITSTMGNNTNIFNAASATNGYQFMNMQNTSGRLYMGIEGSTVAALTFGDTAYSTTFGSITATDLFLATNQTARLKIDGSTGAATFSSTVTTGAPSGGTAKPFKIGNVATVTPTLQNRTIEIEIDGTTYYLTAKTTNN